LAAIPGLQAFGIAEFGPNTAELAEVAEAVDFRDTTELLELLREMEGLTDVESDQQAERFILVCSA
jgi:hypothetical protein